MFAVSSEGGKVCGFWDAMVGVIEGGGEVLEVRSCSSVDMPN